MLKPVRVGEDRLSPERPGGVLPLGRAGRLALRARPLLTAFLLLLGDLLALVTGFLLALWIKDLWDGGFSPGPYLGLLPLLLLFPLAYGLFGLYPGVALPPPEETRRLFGATSLVYAALGLATFLLKQGHLYSRGAFLLAWVLALLLLPLTRALLRHLFAAKPWWGVPAAILGAGRTEEALAGRLKAQPGLGLKPVAFLDDDREKWGQRVEGVPVLGGLGLAPELSRQGVAYAILAMPGVGRTRLLEVLEEGAGRFPHLILIPDLFGMASLHASARDLGGVLGLEVRQNLLLPGPMAFKRAFDLLAASLLLLALLPLFLLLALLVKRSSPGPVFYGHPRIGRGGRPFRAWKFRTMVQDADQVLLRYLEAHPELRAEWERDHKLRDDPRVTPIGRFLRRTSLDELPQLWNVLKGEMSLVGPRPIVEAEVEKYGPLFSLYLKVRPGLTGLWQVSGRNDTGYGERVALDAYYVRNWSLWLDLYILARTPLVVLKGEGAY